MEYLRQALRKRNRDALGFSLEQRFGDGRYIKWSVYTLDDVRLVREVLLNRWATYKMVPFKRV